MRIAVIFVFLLAAAACQRADETSANEAPVATEANAPVAAKAVAQAKAPAGEATAKNDGEAGGSCGDGMDGDGSCKGGCNQWDEAANDVLRRELPADAKWTKLKIEGMTCGGCERRVIANVGTVGGVLKVEADAELGEVRIATKETGTVIASAKEKIASLGYRVVD